MTFTVDVAGKKKLVSTYLCLLEDGAESLNAYPCSKDRLLPVLDSLRLHLV